MLAHRDSSSYPVAFRLRVHPLVRQLLALLRWGAALTMVAFAALLTACGPPDTRTPLPAPSGIEPAAAVTVVIKNYSYVPANFTVPPGATVTVRNEDLAIHTVTSDSGAFNTGNVTRGMTTTFTAPMQRGTYSFHCLIHDYMVGELTVF